MGVLEAKVGIRNSLNATWGLSVSRDNRTTIYWRMQTLRQRRVRSLCEIEMDTWRSEKMQHLRLGMEGERVEIEDGVYYIYVNMT